MLDLFFLIRKTCLFQKKTKPWFKKTGGLFFLKNEFFSTPIIFQYFFAIFPFIGRSGTSNVTISLIGCALRT